MPGTGGQVILPDNVSAELWKGADFYLIDEFVLERHIELTILL